MMSEKSIVRKILRAQGIWDEPTPAAIAAYRDAAHGAWKEGQESAEYDAQMAENMRD